MKDRVKRAFRAELFSPTGLALRAVLLALLFGICELAGLREHTTFLSGTSASSGLGWNGSVVLGVIYIAAYLGFVVVAPILLLAAGMLAAWQKLFLRETVQPLTTSATPP